MITEFKIYENSQKYYMLNLNDMWLTYSNNFQLITNIDIRDKERDMKTICANFKIDMDIAMKNKKIESGNWQGELKISFYGFSKSDVYWKYQLKKTSKSKLRDKSKLWTTYNNTITLDNPLIKVYGEKSKFESNLELLNNVNKYNL